MSIKRTGRSRLPTIHELAPNPIRVRVVLREPRK